MNHAGDKSSIASSRMFNEPYAEIPSGALGTWGCPGSPGSRRTGSSPSICLTDSFVSLCLPLFGPGCHSSLGWRGSFVSLCLPSFVSRRLPAWMPGTALWVDGFICHPLSPFICFSVASQPGCLARLSGWTGSFVSLCLPLFVWHGSLGFVSLHLSPVVSQPGCLARLSRRTDSLVSLCLPSFVSRCLPAWMPGTALWVDSFTCLPLSPLVSQPGCLSRLSRRTDSLVSLGSPSFVSHLCGWTDSFVSFCLPLFVSRCLPAWMPGTALWVDGFICLPLSPSLDVWHSRSAVSFTPRGSVLLAGSGLPSASALASVIPCLVDVGDRVLCLPFIWTSILLGLVVGHLPCLSLATPCLFVQCLVISCGLSLSLLAFGVPS